MLQSSNMYFHRYAENNVTEQSALRKWCGRKHLKRECSPVIRISNRQRFKFSSQCHTCGLRMFDLDRFESTV